jgi:hypothetical protein
MLMTLGVPPNTTKSPFAFAPRTIHQYVAFQRLFGNRQERSALLANKKFEECHYGHKE